MKWPLSSRSEHFIPVFITFLATLQVGNHGKVTAQIQSDVYMRAVEGRSENIEVSCEFDGEAEPPLWLINDLAYELHTVQDYFINISIDGTFTLIIRAVTLCLNGTTFQCLSTVRNQRGRVTVVIVMPNPNVSVPCENITLFEDDRENYLILNNQEVDIGKNNTTLEWMASMINCSNYEIHLQRFDDTNTTPDLDIVATSNNITIPSAYLTNNGNLAFFKLVAVSDRNATCPTTPNRLYSFNASEVLETYVVTENKQICINIPETTLCTSIYLTLPECDVIVNIKQQPIQKFACFKNVKVFNVSLNSTAKQVCFNNWSLAANDKQVNFQCQRTCQQPCGSVRDFLSSYKFVLGPPNAPELNTSLCFFNGSNDLIPATSYNVMVNDITGLSTGPVMSFDNPQCINTTSSLFPAKCGPFVVSVTAISSIGMSEPTTRNFTNTNDSNDVCGCYKSRELVHAEFSKDSEMLSLQCSQNFNNDRISLLVKGSMMLEIVDITCNESVTLPNLNAGAVYSILLHLSSSNCSILNFTIASAAQSETSSPSPTPIPKTKQWLIPFLIGLVVLVVFIVFIISFIVCIIIIVIIYKYYKKNKNTKTPD